MRRALRRAMRWFCLVGLGGVGVLALGPGTAAPDVSVSLQPDPACLAEGERCTLFVYVDSAGSSFNGYETVIRFNPNRLDAIAAYEESVMVDVCGDTWWVRRVGADSVFISHVAMCGPLNATGPGALSAVIFEAVDGPAVTPVYFDYIEFYLAGEIVPSEARDGTVVITPDCPAAGACCLPDGECLMVDEPACGALSGDFLGYFTICAPGLCPQPAVCCVGEVCSITLEAECLDLGGDWYADWTTCDPNPCAFSRVEEDAAQAGLRLECVPTPAIGGLELRFTLAAAGPARIDIVDAAGRLVRSWTERGARSGAGVVSWDGRDGEGRRLPPGVYRARLSSGGRMFTRPVMLLE